MLSLHGVSYRYAGAKRESLTGVSLRLDDGTVTGIVGPGDSGKSTLCLVAGGLAPRVTGGRLSGEVRLDGADVRSWPMHRLTEHVVTALQEPAGQLSLIADTVLDEVAFGPANLGLPVDEVLERANVAIEAVGIGALRDREPGQLSGGQQQLVVLAGLLAMRPRHLVLDEPIAHLDAVGTRLVLDAIATVAADGTAVLIAEQRTEALAAICDSIAVVAAGNIVAQGPPAEVSSDPSVAALGVLPPAGIRLARRLEAAGIDPAMLERRP